jgi:hypothetical protein
MSRSRTLSTALATAMLVATMIVSGVTAQAITDGRLDGSDHPYVGLMVAQDASGAPLWRCSGTLIRATLFLTAGHCTEAPAAHIQIWFAADVETHRCKLADPTPTTCTAADPLWNGYPLIGEASGSPVTHPDFDPARFFFRDLGAVVLGAPHPMSVYGALPSADRSDSLKPSSKTLFTAVGYGLQDAFPTAASSKDQRLRIRMAADPYLLQIDTRFTGDYSLLLSNNANSGGTCFGDSGGPNFYAGTNVIAGVTSYGLNQTCAGTGGVYRLDKAWNLTWLATLP